MSLDIHTILVMFAVLALMLSGLLALASLQAGAMSNSIRLWAFASLCISGGFFPAYFFRGPAFGYDWAVVLGTALLFSGIGLQYLGLRSFLGKPAHGAQVAMLVVSGTTIAFWLSLPYPDLALRAIINSFLLAVASLACARVLFVRVEAPLRTAFWFTGTAYAVQAAALLARAVRIAVDPADSYTLYGNSPTNSWSFFLASVVLLCVTFGFVLMVNYRLIADVHKIASRDMLTDAFTRRRLEEEAQRLLAHCARTGDVLAIMMIDVDHFKAVNDRFGHPVGDEVLRRLSAVARRSIRTDDYFARYGGEEFCILMLSTTEQEALVLAERLRQAYAASVVEVAGHDVKSTISIGVADTLRAGLDWHKLVCAADKALYGAKQQGRNRVVSYATLDLAFSA